VLVKTAMPAELHEIAFIDTWAGNAEMMAHDDNLVEVALAHLHGMQTQVGLASYTPSGGVPLSLTQDGSGPGGGSGPGEDQGWASACSVQPDSPACAALALVVITLTGARRERHGGPIHATAHE